MMDEPRDSSNVDHRKQRVSRLRLLAQSGIQVTVKRGDEVVGVGSIEYRDRKRTGVDGVPNGMAGYYLFSGGLAIPIHVEETREVGGNYVNLEVKKQ